MDGGDDYVMNLGNILRCARFRTISTYQHNRNFSTFFKRTICEELGWIEDLSFTLPVLFSTHIAFFLGSIQREPASTALMVEGGV